MAPSQSSSPFGLAGLDGQPITWEMLLRTSLKGYGAMFFNPRPRAGLWILAGIALAFPMAALTSWIGAVAATAVALRLPRQALLAHEGLLTFNGALVGFGWASIQFSPENSVYSLPLLVLAAALTVPLSACFFGVAATSRLQLPPLSLASLLVLFGVWGVLDHSGDRVFRPVPQMHRPSLTSETPVESELSSVGPVQPSRSGEANQGHPESDSPQGPGTTHTMGAPSALTGGRKTSEAGGALQGTRPELREAQWEELRDQWPSWLNHLRLGLGILCILAGLMWNSWRTALYAGLGVAAALGVGFMFEGPLVFFDRTFVLYAAAPVMVAVGSIFVAPCMASGFLGFSGVAVTWFLAREVIPGLVDTAGVPLFTLPFALGAWVTLIITNLLFSTPGRGALVPIPLLKACTPEAALTWARTLRWSRRFWEDVGRISSPLSEASDMQTRRQKLRSYVANSKRIVVLSGAGISTDSGIPDFRTGVIEWKKYDTTHFQYERLVNSEESRRHYWEMSQDFYLLIRDAKPNQDHMFIAELEALGKLQCIITQNVDRLHQKAGNSPNKVVEIHGNELTVGCLNCEMKYSRSEVYEWIRGGVQVPYCHACQGVLKPESVAFGQPMPVEASKLSLDALEGCDLLLVLGTSLEVEPVHYLPVRAVEQGARLAIVTLHPTPFDSLADVVVRGKLEPDSLA